MPVDADKSTTEIVYASFDRFPSPKGAATHINAFVRALGQVFPRVDLLTIPPIPETYSERDALPPTNADAGNSDQPQSEDFSNSKAENSHLEPYIYAPGVTHYPMPAIGNNLFERVLNYRARLMGWWRDRRIPVVHVRSIYEGYPIARSKLELCDKLVFEVNGLPSIELKYHYPNVADDRELLQKLHHQEDTCLDAADLILTVSNVNAAHLIDRGVPESKIRIIPNGVELDLFHYQPPQAWDDRETRMLYAGTMSSWQGVYFAIEALALYRRDFPARLTLVGPARSWQKKEILNRAWEFGVSDYIELLHPVSKEELVSLHHQADLIVAPLTNNDRNCVQGCCPLKVLEAMASGTPLIASDLPVVRELVDFDAEALLVRPNSGKAIKDGMLRLREDPDLPTKLSAVARQRVERDFSWQRAQKSLITAYEEVLGLKRRKTVCSAAASLSE